MPDGYSYEVRETAYDLFVVQGHTYEQVAEAMGVSEAQLKRWGKDGEGTSFINSSGMHRLSGGAYYDVLNSDLLGLRFFMSNGSMYGTVKVYGCKDEQEAK